MTFSSLNLPVTKDLVESCPDFNSIGSLRDGKSINFAMGSCPDTTMDIVFSEITAANRMLEATVDIDFVVPHDYVVAQQSFSTQYFQIPT